MSRHFYNTLFNVSGQIGLAVIFCVLSVSTQAEVYSWQDEAGNTVYSDKKPSEDAKPTRSTPAVNYFTAPARKQEKSSPSEATPDTLSELSAVEDDEETSKALTEAECQQVYGLSCDRVNNWQRHALEKCGDDSRCKDPAFLDKKYRPRTLAEMQKIANRAASRNNLQDKKIAQFLQRKYGNYCEKQAELYCHNKSQKDCEKVMVYYCQDPRGLRDIFARYDNLNAMERQQIMKKAQAMALANGEDPSNLDKVILGLIDILITQALMGI